MRNVIAILEVKWCMARRDTHHRRGGPEGGCLDSTCASNCGRWILNHLMTFSVDSQRLTTQGHVVFIFAIRFNCRVKWVINPVMRVKKRSFTMVSMMCSITRSNWCAPHQTRIRGHSLCIALLRRMTTPETHQKTHQVDEPSNRGEERPRKIQPFGTWPRQCANWTLEAQQHAG